jgi:hypothetical protein
MKRQKEVSRRIAPLGPILRARSQMPRSQHANVAYAINKIYGRGTVPRYEKVRYSKEERAAQQSARAKKFNQTMIEKGRRLAREESQAT